MTNKFTKQKHVGGVTTRSQGTTLQGTTPQGANFPIGQLVMPVNRPLERESVRNFPITMTDNEANNLDRLFMDNTPNQSLIHNNNNVGVVITPPTGPPTGPDNQLEAPQRGGLEAAAGAEVPAVRDHDEENEDTPAKAKAYNNLKNSIRRRYAMIPAQPPSIANNIAATAIEKEHLPHFHLGGNMFGRKGTKRKSTKRKSTKRKSIKRKSTKRKTKKTKRKGARRH